MRHFVGFARKATQPRPFVFPTDSSASGSQPARCDVRTEKKAAGISARAGLRAPWTSAYLTRASFAAVCRNLCAPFPPSRRVQTPPEWRNPGRSRSSPRASTRPARRSVTGATRPSRRPCRCVARHVFPDSSIANEAFYWIARAAVQIKTGKRFAVKVISKQLMRGKEAMILNEIEVLKKVSRGHENIVTLWDYFETPNNRMCPWSLAMEPRRRGSLLGCLPRFCSAIPVYLVMDLCTGGELFDRICEKGSYYETDAADIIRVVVSAISYLHSQNIVHRDIKAENLLFKSRETSDPRDLVIADFGLSKMMDEDKAYMLMTTCGTPGYMAPEGNKCAALPLGLLINSDHISLLINSYHISASSPFTVGTTGHQANGSYEAG